MPVFFIGLFVLGFRRWVLTEEDQRAFQQLVAEQRLAAEQARGPSETDSFSETR